MLLMTCNEMGTILFDPIHKINRADLEPTLPVILSLAD